MAQNREYEKHTIGYNATNYSTLQNTYSGSMASGQIAKPGHYIVPKLCPTGKGPNYPPKYDTFTHGQKQQCGGYFKLTGAYPFATCDSCNVSYTKRPCSGTIGCGNANGGNGATSEGFRRRRRGFTRGLW